MKDFSNSRHAQPAHNHLTLRFEKRLPLIEDMTKNGYSDLETIKATYHRVHVGMRELAEILNTQGYKARFVDQSKGQDTSNWFLFVEDQNGISNDLSTFIANRWPCITMKSIHGVRMSHTFYSTSDALNGADDWCRESFPRLYSEHLSQIFKEPLRHQPVSLRDIKTPIIVGNAPKFGLAELIANSSMLKPKEA